MPSPIFNAMQGQKPQNRGMDLVQAYNQFSQNPFAFIAQRKGIDIPMEYRNDPQQAVQYLLNSGQMNQSDIDGMRRIAQNMGIKLDV